MWIMIYLKLDGVSSEVSLPLLANVDVKIWVKRITYFLKAIIYNNSKKILIRIDNYIYRNNA